MSIKNKDLPLILALMEDPIAPDSTITKSLNKHLGVNIAISTVNRRIKKLRKEKIVRGSIGIINHHKIGMKIYNFILIASRSPSWYENIERLERMSDLHPYTSYRNRIYGAVNGLFIQFRLPEGNCSMDLLLELFDKLIDKKIMLRYELFYVGAPICSYNIGLNYWDNEKQSWNYNIHDFYAVLEDDHSDYYIKPVKFTEQDSILQKLTMFDIILIRELTRNNRRNQQQIREDVINSDNGTNNIHKEYHRYFDIIPNSKQSFSRRINFLYNSNIFTGSRLDYDRQKFGIFNLVLFTGEYTIKNMGNLLFALSQNYLPFDASIYYNDKQFMIWINLPPVEILLISDLLNNYFDNLKVHLLGRNSFQYYLWHENFNVENHTWKVDRFHMIDSFIDNI